MRSTANACQHSDARTSSISTLRAGVVIAGLSFLLTSAMPTASSAPSPTARVEGIVLASSTKRPVAGATISLPDYGVGTTSRGDGVFVVAEPLPAEFPYRRISAVVTAPGWGTWTIRGVPLYPNDTLRLNVELRADAWEHQVLTPTERRARSSSMREPPPSGYTSTCTGWKYQLVPPQNIKVWITDDSKSKQYDFIFYAAHVLPNEWIPSWDADSLGAGAVAVKTFGYYRAQPKHAYSGGENCADLTDGVADQVFDPTWSTAATDQAVYATVGSVLWKSGAVFLNHYFAGVKGDPCAPVEGEHAGWMSQWGTQTCATLEPNGMLWPEITTTFYEGTTWNYLSNLLLDPDLESAATYAWSWDGGTAKRTEDGSYSGRWHWVATPSPGLKMSLRERRPFEGDGDTTYHAETALRCGPENSGSCSVTLWVVVFEPNDKTHKKYTTVTVSNDGVWRLYTFDPAAFGYVHDEAKLVISSKQVIGVDAAVLTSAYGGP